MLGIEDEDGEEAMHKLEEGINDIIIKSLCLATPHLSHLIKAA